MKGVLFNNAISSPVRTKNTNRTVLYATTDGELNVACSGSSNKVTNPINIPIKLTVRVASTANINLSSTLNSTSIDGVTVTVNDRILLKDQTSGIENGIYVVNSGIATRSTDMPSGESIANYMVSVNQGTLNDETTWTCYNTIGSDVVGTNSLTFVLTQTNNNVEVLTTAGTISPIKEITIINDATAQQFTSIPQYTLAAGLNGTRKRIISNLGYIRATINNLNNQGGQTVLYSGVPCDLLYTGNAWYATNDSMTYYPYVQQGSKLVGTGAVGTDGQGFAVALSYDGNTLAASSRTDNSSAGAVWIFTRSNGSWTQQGSKLTPSDGAGTNVQFGVSVSLSADGNTLAVGGYGDNGAIGAAWIFTRSGTTWSQVGLKLVGTGAVGNARQGVRVSLSGDGLTLASSGDFDNSTVGAVWIFVYSGGSWTQQGSKLVGSGTSGASQITTIELTYDGNLLVMGGYADNSSTGAIWVFTRSGTTWSQRGSKITPSPSSTSSSFGYALGLSSDGALLAVGAFQYSSNSGRAYVFRRIVGDSFNSLNPYYVQVPGYLRSVNPVEPTRYGFALGISKQGKTIAIGGYTDNSVGAVWVYTTQDAGNTWNLMESKITNGSLVGILPFFGASLAMSENGSTMAVGAYGDDTTGSTFIYT